MPLSTLTTPKRGYLANILSVPPLVYPFQYNPAQISDTKANKYRRAMPVSQLLEAGGERGAAAARDSRTLVGGLKKLRQDLGRVFSKADLQELESEGARTLSLKFVIDGREKRPGEPDRRRDASGSILGDLAILHSFTYPQVGDIVEIVDAVFGGGESHWLQAFFNKPPLCLLVMGSTSVEGFVTDLKINQTMFNKDLDPTRAEVELQLTENIDSISFIVDAVKRVGLTFYHTAYEDMGKVVV